MLQDFSRKQLGIILLIWGLAFAAFLLVQQANLTSMMVVGLLGFGLIIIILSKPYFGLVLMYGSLPLYIFTDLPRGLNFTSLTGILGGVTLIAFIWHNKGKPFQK